MGESGHRRQGEPLVEGRVRAALPNALVRPNVRWIARTRPGGPPRDGETDVFVVHPEHGLLAIEVKDGPVSRDGFGRWYAGNRKLEVSPFEQAETGAHALGGKVRDDPRWGRMDGLRELHAVAFPDVDKSSLTNGRSLGPDAPLDLVLDRSDLADPAATARALDRVFRYWSGDGSRDRTLTADQLAVIGDVLEPTVQLRPLLSNTLDDAEGELLAPTSHQLGVLTTLRSIRRASIVGGAGSGKTILAIEKARQLAADGFHVLLVCFNQPLARAMASNAAVAPYVVRGDVTVSTFHELCRSLGTEAGTLPPEPAEPDQAWWSETLPKALERAADTVGGRWQALVVDEGQDFAPEWLAILALLLSDATEDVMYVFHDPAQSIYRADATDTLGLTEFPLPENCRNAKPIHDFAYRFYDGTLATEALRDDGQAPEIVEAEAGEPTLDALREVLRRLVHEEKVDRSRIAVLTGVSLEHSDVWHRRRFKGDLVLWNGGVDGAGRSLKLPADRVAEQPPRTILCETIRRFKGLEADVVVLVELRNDDRLRKLLYVGASRAKHHLIAIVTPDVAKSLASMDGAADGAR
jgi:UvrD-like helicase C-terminal domain/AAA domain/Nuclease-related domain